MLVLMVFERMKKIRLKWKRRFDETRKDPGLPKTDDDPMHGISLHQAILYVCKVSHTKLNDLKEWVVSYVETRTIPEVKVKSAGPIIHNRRNVSKAHILEAISFFKENHSKGGANDYTLLINHLKSEKRVCEFFKGPEGLLICPPVEFSKSVLRYSMYKVAGYSWGKMERKGKAAKTQEQLDREIFRKCVNLVEHHRNLWLQHVMHTHIICYRDESFIHAMHNGQHSLLPRDNNGKILKDINMSVRNGQRVCMSGGITWYGHYTGYFQDRNGKWRPYRDCKWIDKNGNEVEKGGSYVELSGDLDENYEQKVRKMYRGKIKKPAVNTKMLVADVRLVAIDEGVPVQNQDGSFVSKKSLIDQIKARRLSQSAEEEEVVVDDGEASIELNSELGYGAIADQLCTTDWKKLYRQTSDLSPTGDKFFVAGNSKSTDYHDNFCSISTFKVFRSFEITLPYYCQHLQRVKKHVNNRNRTLETMTEEEKSCPIYGKYYYDPTNTENMDKFGPDVPDFYDEAEPDLTPQQRCKRQLIIEHDNAPYNHGVDVNVKKQSLAKCSFLLRKCGLNSITIKKTDENGEEITERLVVPEEGQEWIRNKNIIKADDIKLEASLTLANEVPELQAPGYRMIVDDVMMTRGGKKWLVTYTAPYTSYMCSIEFKWCDGKGYAARPINQRTGRSPAQVVNLVRSKWYDVCLEKLPIDPAVWIKHCHREMNDRIKMWSEDPDISTDSFPLRGDIYDFENFNGYFFEK